MATSIKDIPILTGEAARKFNKLADNNLANRRKMHNVEERIHSLNAILKKANL